MDMDGMGNFSRFPTRVVGWKSLDIVKFTSRVIKRKKRVIKLLYSYTTYIIFIKKDKWTYNELLK